MESDGNKNREREKRRKDRMKHYTWDDIKRRTEKISKIGQQLGNFNLVLFGARLNGSYACQKIKKEYTIYAFSDNNQELWGVLMKEFLLYHRKN